MSERVQHVARIIAERYDGDISTIWKADRDRREIENEVRRLPGFGQLKSRKLPYLLHYLGYRTFS
jgi:hypothetical protein